MTIEQSLMAIAEALNNVADAMNNQNVRSGKDDWVMYKGPTNVKTDDDAQILADDPEPIKTETEVDPKQYFAPPAEKKPAKPAKTTKPAKKAAPKKDEPAPANATVTDEQMTQALKQILDGYGKAGVVKYLSKFNVKSLSQVPVDQRAAFVDGVEFAAEIMED